ncbi:YceD family protein [Crenobacter luteus]|uniref:YceD family protein n=1 Tax=Crenobacter luteus TaxID=1452487 RepID=UPI001FB64A1D|nr:YceD family protein [Crenobacter luteus]
MIDPLAFAREGGALSGDVAVATLGERALEALADTRGTLRYTLAGSVDKLQRPRLSIRIEGEVTVLCQRCLEPMVEALELVSQITFFTDEQKLEDAVEADENLDAVMAEAELDVMALIEDEIIMGLPVSPKHETCERDVLGSVKVDKPNPFAVLATLKKNQTH